MGSGKLYRVSDRCDCVDGVNLDSTALVDAVMLSAQQIEVIDAMAHRVHRRRSVT